GPPGPPREAGRDSHDPQGGLQRMSEQQNDQQDQQPVGHQMDRTSQEVYDAGMAVRREVLGAAHVDRAESNKDETTEDFQNLITRYAWGTIWTRPGLDRRMRSAVTISAMVA